MNKNARWTTPAGIAVWPKIAEPSTTFDADGVYECGLRYVGDDAAKVKQVLKQFAKEGYELKCRELGKQKLKVGPLPLVEEDDASVVLKTKLKAKITRKDGSTFTQRPAVFDARGHLIKAEQIPRIGGGSVLKASVEVFPFFNTLTGFGLSLRLKAVQVIKLVEFNGVGDAKSLGFTAEEEGWVHGESFESEVADKPDAAVTPVDKDEDIPF